MRPTMLLFCATAAAATAVHYGEDAALVQPYAQQAQVQTQAQLQAQAQAQIHLPSPHSQTQTQAAQNRTPDVQRGSTPGTQIMSPWRQVVGGIAVAVLVAVV